MQLTREIAEIGAPLKPLSRETIHHFRVQRAGVGLDGFVDGGTLLEWIDTAAHSTAAQWCAGHCVAASIGHLHLHRPIGVGELVEVRATLVYTGHSSMHILITVSSSDPARAKALQTAQCAMVFVALGDAGEPVEVPRWTPLTMLELQRHRQARARIRMRRHIEAAMEAEDFTPEDTATGTTLRFRGGSTDVTSDGKVRGGRVMRWIDEAAYACGTGWIGADVVTSYVTGIRFYRPVFVGHAVDVTARIIHTGPRSGHMSVRVVTVGESPLPIAEGVIVVVSPGADGEARAVRQWRPVSGKDIRLNRQARHLIELRQHFEPFSAAIAST
jgi:4-hydroxybenzoyl-CoA thioesterase